MPVLALDFDGVVADALTECAAVTWYAGPARMRIPPPPLPAALQDVPQPFLTTFAEVRAYSRTLNDFMVTHVLHPRTSHVDRDAFDRAHHDSDPAALAAQAAVAEDVRRTWRERQFCEWVRLHTIHPEMAQLIRDTAHTTVVVSAKDRESIRSILAHYQLDNHVDLIIGSCHDKRAALAQLLETNRDAQAEGVVFVDDSIANVVAARGLALRPLWALWGYHGPEDIELAAAQGIPCLRLDRLHELSRLTEPAPAQ